MNLIICIGPLLLFIPKFIAIYFNDNYDPFNYTSNTNFIKKTIYPFYTLLKHLIIYFI